jgi:hypothetical protein
MIWPLTRTVLPVRITKRVITKQVTNAHGKRLSTRGEPTRNHKRHFEDRRLLPAGYKRPKARQQIGPDMSATSGRLHRCLVAQLHQTPIGMYSPTLVAKST